MAEIRCDEKDMDTEQVTVHSEDSPVVPSDISTPQDIKTSKQKTNATETFCTSIADINDNIEVTSNLQPGNVSQATALKLHLLKELGIISICITCGYKTSCKNRFVEHLQLHVKKKLSCDLCNYKCKLYDNLQRHFERWHQEKFNCRLCSFECADKNYLSMHLNTHRSNEPLSFELDPLKAVSECYVNFQMTPHVTDHSDVKLEDCYVVKRRV